jgi:hypothetical protein
MAALAAPARWITSKRLNPTSLRHRLNRRQIECGDVLDLDYGAFGSCRDDLDGDRTDLQLDDLEDPLMNQIFVYLVMAEEGGGEEGTLGFARAAERSNFTPCVVP